MLLIKLHYLRHSRQVVDSRARPGQPRERHRDRLARPEYDRLRRAIQSAMEAAGVSQRDLSKRLGMPSSFVNKVLKGTRPLELTEFIDIASALGLDAGDLFKSTSEEAV